MSFICRWLSLVLLASVSAFAGGPHVATHELHGVHFSLDGKRVLVVDFDGYSLWDTVTGKPIIIKTYTEMGLPGQGRIDDKPDQNLRYLLTSGGAGKHLIDLERGTGKPVAPDAIGITYNHKLRTDGGGGLDMATGKAIPLTEVEKTGLLFEGGSLVYYRQGNKDRVFDPRTGKSRVPTKEETWRNPGAIGSDFWVGPYLPRLDRQKHEGVVRDAKGVELSRFKLQHRVADSRGVKKLALPTPEPAMLVWEEQHDYNTGLGSHAYQNYLTAYRVPGGEVLYSIALNATKQESAAGIAALAKRNEAAAEIRRERERAEAVAARNRPPAAANIGDLRGDGIVFYVDSSGQHGLILDIGESIGAQPYPFNAEQRTISGTGGMSAWYVPSLEEWKLVHAVRRQIEGPLARAGRPLARQDYQYYWSSTAVSYSTARGNVTANRWRFHPDSANEAEATVSTDLCIVRLIRAF